MVSSVKSQLNYYEILELTPAATDEDVRAAHLRLIRPYRSRPHESDARLIEKARQISIAFQTLRDPVKRRAYDASIGLSRRPARTEAKQPTRPQTVPFIAAPANFSAGHTAEVEVDPFVAAALREAPASDIGEEPADGAGAGEAQAPEPAPGPEPLGIEDAPLATESETDSPALRLRDHKGAAGVVLVAALALVTAGLAMRGGDVDKALGSGGKTGEIADRPATDGNRLPGPAQPSTTSEPSQADATLNGMPPETLEETAPEAQAAESTNADSTAGTATRPTAETQQSREAADLSSSGAPESATASAPLAPPTAPASTPAPTAPDQTHATAAPAADRSAAPVLIGRGIFDSDNPHSRFQGTVNVRFTVQSDGRVSGCRTMISSGNPDLDARTCQLVEDRLRFKPALDSQGRPVPSEVHANYAWRKHRPLVTRVIDWVRGKPRH